MKTRKYDFDFRSLNFKHIDMSILKRFAVPAHHRFPDMRRLATMAKQELSGGQYVPFAYRPDRFSREGLTVAVDICLFVHLDFETIIKLYNMSISRYVCSYIDRLYLLACIIAHPSTMPQIFD